MMNTGARVAILAADIEIAQRELAAIESELTLNLSDKEREELTELANALRRLSQSNVRLIATLVAIQESRIAREQNQPIH